jgi:ferredoxin--NADP+ reductase
MPHVITSLCTRAGNCAEVCPVSCIVPGPSDSTDWPYFYIDAETCIDCGACVSVCPSDAIFPEDDVPAEHSADIELNRRFFGEGPGYWDFYLEKERSASA